MKTCFYRCLHILPTGFGKRDFSFVVVSCYVLGIGFDTDDAEFVVCLKRVDRDLTCTYITLSNKHISRIFQVSLTAKFTETAEIAKTAETVESI